jgi:hypothetical protein
VASCTALTSRLVAIRWLNKLTLSITYMTEKNANNCRTA